MTPGSRENVPRALPLAMPVLTTAQAAATIVRAVECETREIVRSSAPPRTAPLLCGRILR